MSDFIFGILLTGLASQWHGGLSRIRIYNDSNYAFSDLVVQTPGARHEFGELASRAYTDFREFGESYNYAYVSLTIGDATFVLQPIDYVGEIPLGVGSFTYRISVADVNKRVLSILTTRDEN